MQKWPKDDRSAAYQRPGTDSISLSTECFEDVRTDSLRVIHDIFMILKSYSCLCIKHAPTCFVFRTSSSLVLTRLEGWYSMAFALPRPGPLQLVQVLSIKTARVQADLQISTSSLMIVVVNQHFKQFFDDSGQVSNRQISVTGFAHSASRSVQWKVPGTAYSLKQEPFENEQIEMKPYEIHMKQGPGGLGML